MCIWLRLELHHQGATLRPIGCCACGAPGSKRRSRQRLLTRKGKSSTPAATASTCTQYSALVGNSCYQAALSLRANGAIIELYNMCAKKESVHKCEKVVGRTRTTERRTRTGGLQQCLHVYNRHAVPGFREA